MTGGICYLSLVAVRAEPSEKSEMVNQLLFGDMVEVIDTSGQWLKIRSLHDSYEGWSDQKQIKLLADQTINALNSCDKQIITEISALLLTQGKPGLNLVIGSTLHTLPDGMFVGPGGEYHLAEGESYPPFLTHPDEIAETASLFLNAPYLWGGRSPYGIDCSGLVQIVFKLKGIKLLRDASQQANQGTLINLIEESRAGDVAFFDNEEGKIIHTGIITGRGSIIHASGEVRVDPLDHHGIFNRKDGIYSHKLRVIKRFTD